MAMFKNLGNIFSALSTGIVCGAIAYFTLGSFFPPELPANISYIAFIGGLVSFAVGLYVGWRWAQNIAESLLVELFEKVIVGAIGFVFKAF